MTADEVTVEDRTPLDVVTQMSLTLMEDRMPVVTQVLQAVSSFSTETSCLG